MKKRLISLMLTVCMVLVFFTGMSATASADGETVQHTLQSGETVYGVCQKLGIDFYANYKWITETNKIANYSNLKPGMVLTLPAPGSVANGPAAPAAPSGGNNGAGSGNMSNGLLPGDTVTSYLVPHTMQRGETVGAVCNALGIDFASNAETIQKINNIQDFRRIFVGRTIYLPVSKAPAAGPCIAVVAHKVVSGDAMYNICASYSIDYGSSLKMIQTLNNRTDSFAQIKVGQTILLPVRTVISAGGNSNNGGNNGGNGGVQPNQPGGNNNNGGNNGGNGVGASHSITAYSAKGGKINVPSSAKSGSTVTVKVNPDTHYKLGYISVTDSSNRNAAEVSYSGSSASFTMPNCSVIVKPVFVPDGTDYKVFRGEEKNGSFQTKVNGKAADNAAPGQMVYVTWQPNAGYELKAIKVTYNAGKDTVPVNGDGSFIMPEAAVKVDVSFQRARSYNINTEKPTNGSFQVKVNNSIVSKAESGETVKIVTRPDDGFVVSEITVVTAGGYRVPVRNNSFEMPAENITVSVKFSKDDYNITVAQTPNGSVSVDRTHAAAGDTVTVYVRPVDNASTKSVSFNGNNIPYDTTTKSFHFTMPASDVTVTAKFEIGTQAVSLVFDSARGKVTASSMYPQIGDMIDLNIEPKDGFELETIAVTTVNTKKPVTVNGTAFQMPNDDVSVAVSFKPVKFSVNLNVGANGTASVDKTSAQWGDIVTISYSPYGKAELGRIIVTDSNGKELTVKGINGSSSSFEMPCGDVNVKVEFISTAKYAITLDNCTPEGGIHYVTVDGKTVTEAQAGQIVTICYTPNYGYKLDYYNAKDEHRNYLKMDGMTFVMPNGPVSIDLRFKPAN